MEVPENMKVKYDLEEENVPASAKALQPVLFTEGDSFCCLLGPDPTEGVFGCGPTPESALADWDMHVKERLEQSKLDDEVADYIRDHCNQDEQR